MNANRKDLQKLKNIHTSLVNVMSKIAGLSLETEKSIREETYKIEEARKEIEKKLKDIYYPL